MKHIALFRGINVGGKNKVEMFYLKNLFQSMGFTQVATYINSGNIIFNSDKISDFILNTIEIGFKNEFGFEVPILIKSQNDIIKISNTIPANWQNDKHQKTDVAFLFS